MVWKKSFMSKDLKKDPSIQAFCMQVIECNLKQYTGINSLNHSWKSQGNALSETQYDWRKLEPVTMKANFIHFWCVESEFIVKKIILMSNYEINFWIYIFRFYTSKINEICLHCHWLYFSSIILSFGQCNVGSQNIYDLQCTYAATVSCTVPVHHEKTQLFILLLVPKFIKTSYALMTARLKVAIFVTAVWGLRHVVVGKIAIYGIPVQTTHSLFLLPGLHVFVTSLDVMIGTQRVAKVLLLMS